MNSLSSRGEEFARRQAAGESWRTIAMAEGLSFDTVRNQARRYKRIQAQNEAIQNAANHAAPQFATPLPDELTLEQFIELARLSQQAVNSVDPILTTETITITTKRPVGIVFTSCAHLGSRYVLHEQYAAFLERAITIDGLYWIDLGDQIEGFSGFFDVASASESALADERVQRAMLAKVIEKLVNANKLLAAFAGQHGADWKRRKTGTDPIKEMYLDRRIPYFDGQAYIHLDIGHERYQLFMAHQLPGNSMYNRNHPQKRAALFKAPSADVIAMGDKHSTSVQRTTLDTWESLAGLRPSAEQWYVQASTAKTGPEPYVIKSWSPAVFNWPILLFRPDRHEIRDGGTLDMTDILLRNWQ